MKSSRLFVIAMLVGSLAVIGCGDDGGGTAGTGGSGTAGTGGSGTAGTGGGNGALSTCDALCASNCDLQNVGGGDPDCLSDCAALQPSYATDDCGDEMNAWFDCLDPECFLADVQCADLQVDWDMCAQ